MSDTIHIREDARSNWAGRQAIIIKRQRAAQGARGKRPFRYFLEVSGQPIGWFLHTEVERRPKSSEG